ncbi:MAG: DUF6508 domain-containing protein [Propionibacteriaceae bacterium]
MQALSVRGLGKGGVCRLLGGWTDPVQLADGSWQLASAPVSREASDFMRTSETLGLQIQFDWMPWDHPGSGSEPGSVLFGR